MMGAVAALGSMAGLGRGKKGPEAPMSQPVESYKISRPPEASQIPMFPTYVEPAGSRSGIPYQTRGVTGVAKARRAARKRRNIRARAAK